MKYTQELLSFQGSLGKAKGNMGKLLLFCPLIKSKIALQGIYIHIINAKQLEVMIGKNRAFWMHLVRDFTEQL